MRLSARVTARPRRGLIAFWLRLAAGLLLTAPGPAHAADVVPAGVDATTPGGAEAVAPAAAPTPPPTEVQAQAPLPSPPVPPAPADVPPPLPASPEPAPPPTGGITLGLPPLQVHAFVSQGAILSTENNFLTYSKQGSLEFTEVGINFTQVLTERLRAGIQFFARQLGPVGDYRPRVDWFYLDYAFHDVVGLRVGRTKVPFGLYNEVNDVDSARVPVLLPQSVYPILNRDMLLAQTGLELYGYVRLGPAGALDYRLYGGTLYIDPVQRPGVTLVKMRVPYVVGGRLLWETPLEGLRVGGSAQALRIDTRYALPPAMAGALPGRFDLNLPFFLWLASAEYARNDLLLAVEYGRWRADLETAITVPLAADPMPMPTTSNRRVTNQRYYAMAAYRLAPWLTPGAYYARWVENVDLPATRDNEQHDVAATLRFDINAYWILKLEGHFMRGTLALDPALNDGAPRAMLPADWLLFLAKTTVYF